MDMKYLGALEASRGRVREGKASRAAPILGPTVGPVAPGNSGSHGKLGDLGSHGGSWNSGGHGGSGDSGRHGGTASGPY